MRGHLAMLVTAATVAAAPASAWTRPGHMVAAAIAWDELSRRDPAVLKEFARIMAAHPDPGPFQVAIGRAEGEERDRRIFLETARWPDDIRGGAHDHPTWHYALRPVAQGGASPTAPHGQAPEALALNLAVARDPAAPIADRAVALCWIMHILPDIHQPLHAAERVAAAWPNADQAGSKVWVLDPVTGKPISLHWYWDDSINRDGTPEAAFARARELVARYPRQAEKGRNDAAAWLDESYALARSLAYRSDAPVATRAEDAKAAAERYAADVAPAAEARLTRAAYRLADVLSATLGAAGPTEN